MREARPRKSHPTYMKCLGKSIETGSKFMATRARRMRGVIRGWQLIRGAGRNTEHLLMKMFYN